MAKNKCKDFTWRGLGLSVLHHLLQCFILLAWSETGAGTLRAIGGLSDMEYNKCRTLFLVSLSGRKDAQIRKR